MMTKIYLVRHGESQGNEKNVFCGTSDYKLSKLGVTQAHILTQKLSQKHIDAIYSSPLIRAKDTIKSLAQQLSIKIIVDDNLREMYFGTWENISKEKIENIYPDFFNMIKKTGYYHGIKDQETTETVAKRMNQSIENIAKENIGKTVVIVSHVVAIRAFLCKVQNIPFEETRKKIKPIDYSSIICLEYDLNNHEFKIGN